MNFIQPVTNTIHIFFSLLYNHVDLNLAFVYHLPIYRLKEIRRIQNNNEKVYLQVELAIHIQICIYCNIVWQTGRLSIYLYLYMYISLFYITYVSYRGCLKLIIDYIKTLSFVTYKKEKEKHPRISIKRLLEYVRETCVSKLIKPISPF